MFVVVVGCNFFFLLFVCLLIMDKYVPFRQVESHIDMPIKIVQWKGVKTEISRNTTQFVMILFCMGQ